MNEILNIAICEDTLEEEKKLISILKASKIENNTEVFHSGEELIENFQVDKFDLLLLDIYMTGITGVDAATKIRKIDEDIPIAFITTSKDFALESYRLNALKYIEKPFKKKDVEDILKLAIMKKVNVPSLVITKNKQIEKIPFSKISYLEQQNHHLNLVLKDGEVLTFYDKLADYLPQLEGQDFFLSHKSFAVNLTAVRFLNSELRCFVMDNGRSVPIRRETMSKAKKALEDYLFSKIREDMNEEE